MTLAIGVDIGGTKVLGGVVDLADGTVLATARRHTPADDVSKTQRFIVDVIRELAAEHPVAAVGIGAAGWIDAGRSKVLFAPNLAWRDEPLRDEVAADVGLPVVVENDANAAAWAEYRFGAGADASSLALFTVGTGIGGGLVYDGHLLRGAHGIAAEFGHQRAVVDGHPCGCGQRGCLEQYASGRALVRESRSVARLDPQRADRLLELAGGDPEVINGPMVTVAAQAGCPVALAAFDEVGRWLGIGLANLVQVLDPEVLVVGGGVAEAGELLLAPTRRSFAAELGNRGRFPVAEIRAARMGNTAGLIGAADLGMRG